MTDGRVLRLVAVRRYLGHNLYCDAPAVAGELELGAADERAPVDVPALLARLPALLPEAETAGELPPLAALRLPPEPPAAVALLAAWLAAHIQNFGGAGITAIGWARTGPNTVVALSGYEIAEVAAEAMRLACAVIGAAMKGGSDAAHDAQLRDGLVRFAQATGQWQLDQTTRDIANAAADRGIPWYRLALPSRFVQLGHGARQCHIFESLSSRTSASGHMLSRDKCATAALLAQLGVPVPEQVRVASEEQALAAAARLGYPVVVKPSHGGQGRAVTTDIRGSEALAAAYRIAAEARLGSVLVEKHVPGDDYRLLVIGGDLVAAARKVPPHVIGDGRSTIEALAAAVNRDPRRGPGFRMPLTWLPLDAHTEQVLATQGFRLSSVPEPGRRVLLRGTANLSTGGTPEDVTSRVHPDVRDMAILIAQALHLDAAGIDYLTPDIGGSCRNGGGAVCDVNTTPGLRAHLQSTGDRARVLGAMLRLHYPDGDNGRIPIAAITGSTGKTTTCRMVAAMQEAAGRMTALVCSDGVFVGRHRVRTGDCAGGMHAQAVLKDPRAQAAVLELARGGLIRAGVPVDACDVAAVLNVSYNHIGQDGVTSLEALAAVKSLIVRTARRAVVLNADDPHCASMARLARDVPVWWVTRDSEQRRIRDHLSLGGCAVTLRGSGERASIVLLRGAASEEIARVSGIAAAMNGVAEVNITNAMFAAAVGAALGVALEDVRRALASFHCDFASNPGRCNVHLGARRGALLDRADSPEDVHALATMAGRLPVAGRRILALTAPGNRLNEHIRGMAEAAAGGFDHFVCYSWEELRGRDPGEVPAMLAEALHRRGVSRDRITVIPDEDAAIAHAIDIAGAGDLVTVVSYQLGGRQHRIWDALTNTVAAALPAR